MSAVEYDLIGRDLGEIRAIEQARARFDNGSYGICADCGQEIGWVRLNVNPAAVRCARCQDRCEKDRYGPARGSR